ncbi:DUF262 domain-containing protein [Thermus sp.]|uniref:DUF262 domain-containing protein n=1 Tax=Thermus sp. TaxID=275 RepID=UPI003D0E5C5D
MLKAAHDGHSLFDLVDKSHRHEYQVPEFQRDLVWRPEQVRELLVSLVQGHYAGALLMLKLDPNLILEFDPNTPPFAHREIYGAPPLPSPATSTLAYSVLDGQQRISAVYYAFQHPNLPLPPSSKKRPYRFFLRLDKFFRVLLDLDPRDVKKEGVPCGKIVSTPFTILTQRPAR